MFGVMHVVHLVCWMKMLISSNQKCVCCGFNLLQKKSFHQAVNKSQTSSTIRILLFLLFCFKSRSTAYNSQGPQAAQWKVRTCCKSKSVLAQQTAPGSVEKEKGHCCSLAWHQLNKSHAGKGPKLSHQVKKTKQKTLFCPKHFLIIRQLKYFFTWSVELPSSSYTPQKQ